MHADVETDEGAVEQRLIALLAGLPEPVLAFSGGVDSSYLLSVLAEARGAEGFRAVLGVSPSLAARQREQALAVAGAHGVAVIEIETREGDREEYRRNLGDRCFFCKDTLFATLRARFPAATLLDGTHADDLQGHRPGRQAALEHGVRSPLVEVGLRKAGIRRLSARRRLATAELPSSPCLASRFPAGVRVTDEGLRQIEAAEEALRALGFDEVRVRHHGEIARIEVPAEDIPRLASAELAGRISEALKRLGWRFVSLDLSGYRSGSGSTLAGAGPV